MPSSDLYRRTVFFLIFAGIVIIVLMLLPFVEGGFGAIRNEIATGPMRTTSTNVALIAGGGLDMQLTNSLGLRLMVKDHISRFDYGEALGVNAEGRRSNNWVAGVGINIGW